MKKPIASLVLLMALQLMVLQLTLFAQGLINCDIQTKACTRVVNNTAVQLDILPKPVKAMRDLLFRVKLKQKAALDGQPFIDLGMPGMHMGPNRVQLEKAGPGLALGGSCP